MSEFSPENIIGFNVSKEEREKFEKPKKRQNEWQVPERLKQYEQKAKDFLERNTHNLAGLAGDKSLRFKLGPSFRIDFTHGVVYVSLEQWAWADEHDLGDEQILWCIAHELAHFWDLKEDPDGLLGNFDYTGKKAKELAPRAISILEAKNGPLPSYLTEQRPLDKKHPEKTESGLEYFITKQLDNFYNCLDDIYVNKKVGQSLNKYSVAHSEHSEKVIRLYRDFLFPTDSKNMGVPPKDETVSYYLKGQGIAKAKQFGYYLLRKRMVPDQTIFVDDDVKAELDKVRARRGGKDIRLEELVDYITNPSPSVVKREDSHIASNRYEFIQKHIEPIFIEFLMKDLAEQEIPPELETKPEKGEGNGEGQGEGGEDGGNGDGFPQESDKSEGKGKGEEGQGEGKDGKDGKSGEGTPDGDKGGENSNPWQDLNSKNPFGKGSVEDFIEAEKQRNKEVKTAKKEEERRSKVTQGDRIKEALYRSDEDFANQHEIDQQVVHDYRVLSQEVSPYKEKLAELFEKICQNIKVQVSTEWKKYFTSGKLDVQRLIRQYGMFFQPEAIEHLPLDRLSVYLRKERKEQLRLTPDEFRIRFIVDCSSSMANDQKARRAQQIVVLFLDALAAFESKLEREFGQFCIDRPVLRARVQIITFGSKGQSKEVKKLDTRKKINPEKERIERMLGFAGLHANGGATYDDEAWQKVRGTFTNEDAKKIKKGQLKDVALELTDGESQSPNETRDTRLELAKSGMLTKAIAIIRKEDVGYKSAKKLLAVVWGQDVEIVEKISDVQDAAYKLLKGLIESLKFEVRFASVKSEEREKSK